MIGHIIKIEGYTGLWVVIARSKAGYVTALSVETDIERSEGAENHLILYGVHIADISARANDYTIKINSFIFDDTKKG